MAENSSTSSIHLSHNENTIISGQTKEAIILNNNLSLNRAFGRDISNLRATESNAAANATDKQETQLLTIENPEGKIGEIYESGITDLSLGELPDTSRDPLLASREVLAGKTNNGVSSTTTAAADMQKTDSKRMQKVPLNLFALENCDILEINNPQYVSLYAKEIFDNLQADEEKFQAKFGEFTRIQTDINEKMRAILVDWLVEVQVKFKLQLETLYIAVNLTDRYLEKVHVIKEKLQLVGITAMFIASKYQEIYPPELRDFVHATDKTYRREEILEMEGNILNRLVFKLTIPSAWVFLERFGRIACLDRKSFFFCQYVIELALSDYNMLRYSPSTVVRGAIQIAREVFKTQNNDKVLFRNIWVDPEHLRLCCKDLLSILRGADKNGLKIIRRKYSSVEFLEVAKIQVNIP